MLSRLTKRFNADPTYHERYTGFLNEYEALNHMKQVPPAASEPEIVYYLPHHGVIQESSTTSKLRVVFNGSSRTSTGVSLNDILHTGAKLQVDLLDVMIWFRQFRYVFSTDIEKMYRQINVHPDDWNLRRILWQNSDGDLRSYQLATVTYGLACAPFSALRTLLQLIKDEGHRFPLAVPILQRGRYVDDIFGGADSVQQAQEMVEQVDWLCKAGGFSLQKWISNHPAVIASIPREKQVPASSLLIEGDTTISALGLTWKPTPDTFHFITRLPSQETITKRSILSTTGQLFDPLGLVSPVIICAEILLQELWTINVDWDDPLPTKVTVKWIAFTDQFHELSQISCPRWLGLVKDSVPEINGFSDASQQAIAAAIYLRTTTPQGEVHVALVCSKTKVAPLKRLNIPRLELAGAVLLIKLAAHIIRVLNVNQSPVFLWTDSTIVYTWINNHPSRWKEYVHNRVCFIQETLPQAKWRVVPGTDNPADCVTRGLTPGQLAQFSMWWVGPQWLTQPPLAWPAQSLSSASEGDLEERPSKVLATSTSEAREVWDLIHPYSSLIRLLRITALCQRFVARLRGGLGAPPGNHITPQELEQAKIYWVKQIQEAIFHHEIQTVSRKTAASIQPPLTTNSIPGRFGASASRRAFAIFKSDPGCYTSAHHP